MNLPLGDGFSLRTSTVSVLESGVMQLVRSITGQNRYANTRIILFLFHFIEVTPGGIRLAQRKPRPVGPIPPRTVILAFFEKEEVFGLARQALRNPLQCFQAALLIVPLPHVNQDVLMSDVVFCPSCCAVPCSMDRISHVHSLLARWSLVDPHGHGAFCPVCPGIIGNRRQFNWAFLLILSAGLKDR